MPACVVSDARTSSVLLWRTLLFSSCEDPRVPKVTHDAFLALRSGSPFKLLHAFLSSLSLLTRLSVLFPLALECTYIHIHPKGVAGAEDSVETRTSFMNFVSRYGACVSLGIESFRGIERKRLEETLWLDGVLVAVVVLSEEGSWNKQSDVCTEENLAVFLLSVVLRSAHLFSSWRVTERRLKPTDSPAWALRSSP